MTTPSRLRPFLLLLLDAAVIALEIPALYSSWIDSGVRMFRYYTQDSNLLALSACALCLPVGLFCLIRRRPLPAWTKQLRYVSACCLMVTFLVAAFILVPMERHNTFRSFMLEGDLLYLHTVCPLLMLLGTFLHGKPELRLRHTLLPLVPTLVYGIVTIAMNLRHVYYGPYPFLRFHEQTPSESVFWCIAIPTGNWLLACALSALTNAAAKKPAA